MRVLIAGANGDTGRQILQLMSEGTDQVFAMVGHGEDLAEARRIGADRVVEAETEGELIQALENVQALVIPADEHVAAFHRDTIRALLDVAERQGVRRVVMLSTDETDDLGANLSGSDLEYTLIHAGSLTDDLGDGKISADDDFGHDAVPRADAAQAAVASLYHHETKRRSFGIHRGSYSIDDALERLGELPAGQRRSE